jgi:hypothetical protein
MYQQALTHARHVATVCDAIYQSWADEVEALPPRKRKKWSGWIADKYGSRISVRYAPQEVGLGQHTLFEERLTAKSAADRGLPVGTWIPIQSVSIRAAKAAAAEEMGGELLIANTATRAIERPALDNDQLIAQARADVAERHTGNHRPHVHAVRVPTAPGQPVRA